MFRQSLDDESISYGMELQSVIESTDSGSMLSLVKGGIGAAIISCTLFSQENEGLKAIRIINPTIKREVTIIHHKQKYIGTAARGFIELLMKYIEEKKINDGSPERQHFSICQ